MAHIDSRVTFDNVPIDKLKVAMVSPMPNSQVLIEDQIKTEIQNSQSDSSDQIKKFKNENCCDVCGKYFKRKWVLQRHMVNYHDSSYTIESSRTQVLKEDQIMAEIQNTQSDSSDQIKEFKNENCCEICGKYFKRKWALDNHTINCYRYPAELSG